MIDMQKMLGKYVLPVGMATLLGIYGYVKDVNKNKDIIKYMLAHQKKELLKKLRKEVDPSGYVALIDIERIFKNDWIYGR